MRVLRAWLVLAALVLGGPAGADEFVWLSEALFGRLNATVTFDVNRDAVVTAADFAARASIGQPHSAGCAGPPPPAGLRTMTVDAVVRQYTVRLPATYDHAAPRPVVFDFHGFTSNAAVEERITELAVHWPEAIGVYPQGLPRTFPTFPGVVGPGWQTAPNELGQRDLRFFDALVAELTAGYCVNPDRFYATGFSNGAVFSHLLGCTRREALAAIGPRAGFIVVGPVAPPLPAIMSHGTADPIAPFTLGAVSYDFWTERNRCTADTGPYGNGCEIHADCANGTRVAFCAWDGGHVPDPQFAADLFRFFREHAR